MITNETNQATELEENDDCDYEWDALLARAFLMSEATGMSFDFCMSELLADQY